MTQPYIKQHYIGKGRDPVEAAGSGTVSQEGMLDKYLDNIITHNTIDSLVSPDMLSPEIEEHLPTYNPMSLDEATGYFRGCYIAKMAEYTGKTSISDLANKVLDYDRSELSRLVSSYGLKDYLAELEASLPDTKAKYERDIADSIFDPIVRRVFREAISEGYYGLKDATDRFKDIYVNNVAEDLGIRYASEVLDVSEKTIRNRIESYKADQRNSLSFPDDCKPRDLEGIAEQETSTQRLARAESELWQQRQQQQQAQTSRNG